MFDQRFLTFVVAFTFIGVISALCLPTTAHALSWQTESDSSVINANSPAADTIALDTGQVSVSFQSTAGGDTRWSDTSTVLTTSVDTGFDMYDINADSGTVLADSFTFETSVDTPIKTGSDTYQLTFTPGDSKVLAVNVHNMSNNGYPLTFDRRFLTKGGSLNGETFTLELYRHNGDSTADQFDPNASDVSNAPQNGTDIFSTDEVKTYFLVITAADTAGDGDSETSEYFVTDNATLHAPATDENDGDSWQRGKPLVNANDDYDTQQLWLTSTVQGPDIVLTKSYTGVSQDRSGDSLFRPGDTVIFTITIQNNGGDTATSVQVTDAIPDNTTIDTATFVDTGGNSVAQFNDGIGYSSSNTNQFDFQETPPSTVERVMWALETVGPSGQFNDTATAELRVTID